MPWSATYNTERHLIEGSMSGDVTAEDLLNSINWVLALPADAQQSNERWDCTAVTAMQMDYRDIVGMAGLERDQRTVSAPLRNAIIVAGDQQYGVARIYAALAGDDEGMIIRVFHNPANADLWLSTGAEDLGTSLDEMIARSNGG